MMKKGIFPLLLVLCCAGAALSQDDRTLVDHVIGIVGENIVLHSDIELQYQQMKLEGTDFPGDFKCAILDQMLAQKMLKQQAELDSLVVSEDEIEGELDRRVRYFVSMIGSEEKLEEYYGKSIVRIKDEFRKDIREQLLSQKMRSNVLEKVKVTPADVKAFFNAIPSDSLPYFNAEVEVGQIVVNPVANEELKDYTRKSLEGIRERIIAGEDFCVLARLYSEDPGSAEQCGDLGFIKRGEMVTEFEGAAFRLSENEVSNVVETKFGFHLLQMLQKKGDRIRVRHILMRPKTTSYDLILAKQKLDSVRTLIVDGKMKFEEAAAKFSEDEATKNTGGMMMNPQSGNTYFEVDQLDKSIFFTIEKLSAGEVSAAELVPTPDGLQAYRILYLKSESAPHEANLKDDYSKIKSAAAQKKEDLQFDRWIKDKVKDSYVFVEESYRSCDLMKKWLKAGEVIETTY
jgi:peptidyl-prolyl cis-trans isomerase SurA